MHVSRRKEDAVEDIMAFPTTDMRGIMSVALAGAAKVSRPCLE